MPITEEDIARAHRHARRRFWKHNTRVIVIIVTLALLIVWNLISCG